MALVLHHLKLRLGITQCSNPPFLAQGDSSEVHRQPVAGKELMVSWRPGAGKLQLCGGGPADQTGIRVWRRRLFCGARRGIPFRSVSLLLELRTGCKRLAEVLRIVNDGGYQQHLAATGDRREIEVFRNGGVLAIGNAILSQIPGRRLFVDTFSDAGLSHCAIELPCHVRSPRDDECALK